MLIGMPTNMSTGLGIIRVKSAMGFFSFFNSLSFLLFIFLFFLLIRKHGKKSSTKAPGSSLFSWLNGVREAIRNRQRVLEWTTELLEASHGNTITMVFAVITANPSNVEHLTKTKFDNYPKGDRLLPCFEDILGHGIFNSDGEHWKLLRRTACLQFNTKPVRAFTMEKVHLEISSRLIPVLKKASAEEETLDLQDVLDRFAFDNVCQVAFDVDPAYLAGDGATAEEGRRLAQAFDQSMRLSSVRFGYPHFLWKLKKLFNLGSERKLRKSVATVNEMADKVVRCRKMNSDTSGSRDLLSGFIAEGFYSDQTLRDVIMSFILAGRDTTSSALSWFFWILSSRLDVERKILEEVRSVRGRHGNSDGGFLTLDQLREMQYLHAALTETLRLYPPVPLEVRTSLADDVLPDGTFVRKGGMVMYNLYVMGRSETTWGEDCREFKPERWLENEVFQPKSPFIYPVFHAGPRMCLGKEMAYTQMKLVAASVLEMFEMVVVGKENGGEHLAAGSGILRMKDGLPVRVRVRREPTNC